MGLEKLSIPPKLQRRRDKNTKIAPLPRFIGTYRTKFILLDRKNQLVYNVGGTLATEKQIANALKEAIMSETEEPYGDRKPHLDVKLSEERKQQIATGLAEVYVRENLHRLFLGDAKRHLGNIASHLRLAGIQNVSVEELKEFVKPIAARVISQTLRFG